MKCAACNHENRDGARFCEECATPLRRVCASCGAELRPTAKFCDECAAPTAAGAAQPPRPAAAGGARKVVTVVFADLVGSTALHERVDAESARRLMERYYEALRGAVEEHGGTVVKLLGDGVMAAFGVPQVAEDDAVRAVRAGMAMQAAFRALVGRHSASFGEVALRVAVNTGEVVVSGANDDVVGDPVNVAARLQQEAHDGDVVIGEETQQLVAALVTLEPLGSVAIKGRSEAVRAYRVASLERPVGASAAPFVGRESELARITRVYDSALATPAARLAVVLGSPGLGKSRLIHELGRRLGERASLIAAHCNATGGTTFAPIAQALRGFLGVDDATAGDALRTAIEAALPGDDTERGRIAGGIASLLAGAPAAPEETFFVVRRLLGALATRKPLVLVIDDLHWAEPLLLDLVEHLVQWGAGVPLLVLVGARPELRDTRSSLATPGNLVTDVVTLGGLDAGAATRLAAHVIGASDLPAAVAAKVLATSEGNPLFVGELVRMLVHEGVLTREGDRWTVGEGLASFEMPPTIHALLAARIERLRPEERVILEHAAVVGRHFSRSAVAELLPRDVVDLDARLEALRRSELIERDTGWFLGEPVLRFHHVLVRDAAYRRLLKGTRAELHGRFADWIESRVGDAIEQDETIGWHLEQAHQLLGELGPVDAKGRVLGERAARRLAAAGRRALARDDVSLAANLLGRAIERVTDGDPTRPDLALDWCEALLAAGEVGAAGIAIDELGRLSDGSDRLRAWHTCFAGQLTALTAPEALRETADAVAAAAEQLAKLGDAGGEAKAHFVHAQALARLGKVGAGEAALDRALAAARRAGDRRRANAVLAGAPLAALWGPSPVTRASGRCLDVVRVLRITQGAPAVEAVALSCQGVLEALRGRTDAARRMIASSRKMVEELGITHRLLESDVFAGQIDLLEGNAPAAERSLRAAYDGLRDLGLGIDAAQAAALLARALLAQGRAAEAETLSHESEALAGDDLKAAIAWRGVRAEALARRGEHAAAVELAEAAVAIASATDALLDHADARLALAAALRAAGRTSEAAAEERRATELWEAKGATLLAERARRGDRRVMAPAAAETAVSTAPRRSRRRIRPNAATATSARWDAEFAGSDVSAFEAVMSSALEVVDHPNRITYGRAEALDSFVRFHRMRDARMRREPLATLGESLALCLRTMTSSGGSGGRFDVGAYEVEQIVLDEVDERGRFRRQEVFDADRLSDAVARLYERYAEILPDGGVRSRAAATAHAVAAVLVAGGGEGWAAALTPDAELVDNRRLGTWNARGRDAIVGQVRSLQMVADGVTIRTLEILDLGPEALLVRRIHSGIERVGGGSYERPLIMLLALATDGRVLRVEFFDDDAEGAALARVNALTGRTEAGPPRPVQRRIRMNAARMMWVRTDAAIAARDPDAFVPLFCEDYVEIDHPTGSTYGLDEALASIKLLLRSRDVSYHHEPLATLGESLALSRRRVGASGTAKGRFDVGEYESEAIALAEVDERGLCVRYEVFAPHHLGDAIARLYERYAELLAEGPARERASMTARAATAMFTESKEIRLEDVTALADLQSVDHRLVGYGAAGGEDFERRWRDAWDELTEERHVRVDDVLALTPDGLLRRSTAFGTLRDGGGAFETTVCGISVFGPDGRHTCFEIFDVGHEAEALARFEELVGGQDAEPLPRVRRRVRPNAATPVGARLEAAIRARDLGAIDALLGNCDENIDHPTGARFGRQGALDSAARLLRVPDFDFQIEILATLGESLCLVRRNVASTGTSAGKFDVAEYELERIGVYAVDGDGRIARSEVFASDHLVDAVVRLYELRAEELPEGASRRRAAGIARAITKFRRGLLDPNRLDPPFAATVVMVDHRRVGLGILHGVEAVAAALRAFLELVEDVAWRTDDVLALTDRATLFRATNTGTDRTSGGCFERSILSLAVYDGEGWVERWETFEAEEQAAALARFDELTTEPRTARSRRLRVRPNGATAATDRFAAAFAARDAAALESLFSDSLTVVDNPNGATYGRDGHLDSVRRLERATDPTLAFEPLATLGESLSLSRRRIAAKGASGGRFDVAAWQREEIVLFEAGEGERVVRIEVFSADRLGDAGARLYERYAERLPDGPAKRRAEATARSVHALVEGPGWRGSEVFGGVLAPDVNGIDHRTVGFGSLTGVEAMGRAYYALVDLTQGITWCLYDMLRLEPDAWLTRVRSSGKLRAGGGSFERELLMLCVFGPDGLVTHYEQFDGEQETLALARFGALTTERAKARPLSRRVRPNAASAAADRFAAAIAAQNGAALETVFSDSLTVVDYPTGATYGRAAHLDSVRRFLRENAPRLELELLATLGGQLALARSVVSASGGASGGRYDVGSYEREKIALFEVDERGQCQHIETFGVDHLGDAGARLYQRYAELLPEGSSARHRAEVNARSVATMMKGPCRDEFRTLIAPDIEGIDHRTVGYGSLSGAEAMRGALGALLDLTENLTWLLQDILRLEPRAWLVRVRSSGVLRAGGGTFERETLVLSVLRPDGLITHYEQFDAEQAALALTRFDALVGADGEGSNANEPTTPFANAATRMNEAFVRSWAARDWDALTALHSPDCQAEDRRPLMRLEESTSSNFSNLRVLFEVPGGRWTITPIATRGERLSLSRMLFEGQVAGGGGDLAIDFLCVDAVDVEGLSAAVVSFAVDDVDAACAELDARYEAGEAKVHERASAFFRRYREVIAAREWDSLVGLCAPAIVGEDHRLVNWGTLRGPEAWADALRKLLELAPDTGLRVDHVRTRPHAVLFQGAWFGTREGGEFEIPVVAAIELDELGRQLRLDVYDDNHLDDALARFDAIGTSTAPAAQPFANAATRFNERFARAWIARDWDAVVALHVPTGGMDDRRRLMRMQFGHDSGALEQLRFMFDVPGSRWEITPLATRGERLALSRCVYEGNVDDDGGALAIDYLMVDEVDADGRNVAVVILDLDDVDAAYAELDARYEAGEARAQPLALATMTSLRSAWAERDWDGLVAKCGPRFRLRDHRLLGWGTTVGAPAEWVRTQQALVELAPDVRIRTDHVRLCERGWLRHAVSVGTREGGVFELPLVMVTELDEHGQLAGHDLYDPEQLAQAFARFEEIRASAAEPEPRFANFGTRALAARIALFVARDWLRFESLLSADFCYLDRRRIAQLELDRDQYVAFVRQVGDLRSTRAEATVLATRGERLALGRARAEFAHDDIGPSEIESLLIVETDDRGTVVAFVRFDVDDLDAAYAELDARFEAGEGAAHPLTAAWRRDHAAALARRDWNEIAMIYSPDFVAYDSRLVGWETVRGPMGIVGVLRATCELAPDIRIRGDHVRTSSSGILFQSMWVGTRDGGAFESQYVSVFELDDSGKARRADFYDSHHLDRAFARFEEIRASAAEPEPRFANAASRALARTIRCFNTRDWDAMIATYAPDHRMDDRRKLMRIAVAGEGFFANERLLFEVPGSAWHAELVATRGERLALCRVKFTAGGEDAGPMAVDALDLVEVDSQGRRTVLVVFDPDDLDAAHAELDARFGAGEAAEHSTIAATVREYPLALGRRDWEAIAALCAPEVVAHDHRLVGWDTLRGPAAFVKTMRAMVALAPDARVRSEHVRISSCAVLNEAMWLGTHDGGAFESVNLSVVELDERGKVRRIDFYDPHHYDRALACFEEIGTKATKPEPRFANAATRAMERHQRRFYERDWEGIEAGIDPAARVHDRRRLVRLESSAAEFLAGHRVVFDVAEARWETPVLATRGERLSLHRVSFFGRVAEEGGPLEMDEHFTLVEVGADSRFIALVLFDLDDLDAAYAELDARFETGEAKAHARVLATLRAKDAYAERDWDRVSTFYSGDFVLCDHRVLGWGTLDGAPAWVRIQRSLIELAPDAHFRLDHIRMSDCAYLSEVYVLGTRDGGVFEMPSLHVRQVDETGQISRIDIFDVDDLDQARACFDAITARTRTAVRSFANAATRAFERGVAAMNARDWERFAGLFAIGFRSSDRRALLRFEFDREQWLASNRQIIEMTTAPPVQRVLATRGERLTLVRLVWQGAAGDIGPSEIDWLLLIEVDEHGDHMAVVTFDPDDVDAAYAELDTRYEAGEGTTHGNEPAMYRAAIDAINRRDWNVLAARCGSGFHTNDHRLLGWGKMLTDATMWVRSQQALVGLSPDVRYRINHVRECRRGALIQLTQIGTRDGGAFETPLVAVSEWNESDRYLFHEMYDVEKLDEAFARFDELRARDLREENVAIAPPAVTRAQLTKDNRADRAMELWQARFHAAVETGDWDQLGRVCAPGMIFEDRRRLALLEGGAEMMVASARERAAVGARPEFRLIGDAGDRIAILQMLWAGGPADGRFEIEYLAVNEVDEAGQLTAIILFDLDDARAAKREARARWAAIDSVAAPWVELLTDVADAWNAHDAARVRAKFADDLVVEDRRRTGLGRIEGADAYVDSMVVLWELAPDQRVESGWSWPALDHHGALVTQCREGTLADGGAFESHFLWLGFATQGRLTRLELFEPEELDTALARFEELRPDPLAAIARPERARLEIATPERARVEIAKPTKATEAMQRWEAGFAAALETGDWNALRDVCAPAMTFEDRQRLVRVTGDRDLMVASARERAVVGARRESWPIGAAGDRVGIWRTLWSGGPADGRFEIECLVVVEVDEAGKIVAIILFDSDDARAAQREAWERWTAIDPVAAPWVRLAAASTDAFNTRDATQWRALCSEDLVVDDRRRTGFGSIQGLDAYVDATRVLWDLSPDTRVEIGWYWPAYDRHAAITTARRSGTIVDGGPFESVYLMLYVMRAGLATRVELFELEDLDAALARFEELRPDPLRIPPNSATATKIRARDAMNAADWDTVRALCSKDFVYEDRGKRSLVSGDVETWIASMKFLVAMPEYRNESESIATAGDRIAVAREVWHGHPDARVFEIERYRLTEVDVDGRVCATILFDPDDRAAAFLEATEHFLAGEAAEVSGRAALFEAIRAHNSRDWRAFRETLAPDFVFHDHRTLGMGEMDRDRWIESIRVFADMCPDIGFESRNVLAWNRHGIVTVTRSFGTVPDGGPFENIFVAVRLIVDDLVQRNELFDLQNAEGAIARFEELCSGLDADTAVVAPRRAKS